MAFFVWLVLLLSIPPIQTLVAEKVTESLNEKYGTSIHVSKVGLNWTGRVSLREVLILDHQQDTLIYTKRLRTRLKSIRPLLNGNLSFQHTYLTDPYLHIKTHKGEEKSNIEIFADKFGEGSSAEDPFTLTFSRLILDGGVLYVTDENYEEPDVYAMHDIYLKTDNFKLVKDVIDAEIQKLAFTAFDTLEVTDLYGNYHYSPTGMSLKKMTLQTESSSITGNVRLDYPVDGLSDFEEVVEWTMDLQSPKLSSNDIKAFYADLGAGIEFHIDTNMKGTLNDFTLTENTIGYRNTSVQGDFKFADLLHPERKFQIQSEAHIIKTNTSDLEHLLPKILRGVIPKEIERLGNIYIDGKSTISEDAIYTKGNWGTQLGTAKIDLDLKNIKDFENASYYGKIDLKEFGVGELLDNKNIGKISSVLKVDGKGTKAETLNTKIDGAISSFVINNYNYTNILLEGGLRYPLFNGVASIKDRNLDLDFDGLINMSEDINEYDFEAKVNFSDLNQLGLVTRDSIAEFTGIVIMDMQGTSVDDAIGEINFKETFYQTNDKYYYFDDFAIRSSFEEEHRTIAINSPDIVTGHLTGRFKLGDLPQLIMNGIGSIYTNYKPKEVTRNQYISYDFEIHNKIVDVFIPQLEIGDNTRLKGEVSSDDKTFKMDFVSPEIMAYNNYIEKINLQVDYDNPMHNTYLTVGSIHTKLYTINGLEIENTTKNDTLSITSNFRGGEGQKDFFDLSFYHTINPEGQSVFGVKRSGILFDNNLWYLNHENNAKNRVVIEKDFKRINVDSLVLNHNEEYIRMAGVVRDSTYKDLHLDFENVRLSHLIRNVDSLEVMGQINGRLNLKQERGNYFPTSTIRVDGLVLNDLAYGDFMLDIIGNEDLTRYDIESSLIEQGKSHFSALGHIDISQGNPYMNVNLDFDAFDISGFSPFGAHVVSRLRGLATGRVQLSGDPRAPEALGRLYLKESGMHIPYLNVDYKLGDNTEVVVNRGSWRIDNTRITDTKYNSQGSLTALVTHNNFKDINFDMRINANEMLVLDTTEEEDALYFGTAFISGQAHIHGPAKELTIDVLATTEKNTSFTIPLSDAESIGDDSFIVFLSPEEKEKRLSGGLVRKEIKGLSVNFDLDINNKAEVHVVVDKTNNSTLRARGVGTLLIQLNTLGKFNMEGDFQVVDGDFDFRYGGIIHKVIKVVPGGFISWDGNPERAVINLQTKYETDANPSVLLDNTSINRTIPVEVIIDLSGELIQPDLAFDIVFPRVSSSVKSELEYKLQNREERDKQALFLIASGSFVNDNFQGSNAFSGTLADKVSGLLNELFADKDGKFTVGLDYTQGSNLPNQETADRFGVSLSTHINERILINGKVGVPVGGVYENSIAGDIEVQWLVNEDGSLRLLFFNRQADIQFLGENQIFEQGAGISYSVDFATFKELVDKLFNKKIELESKQPLEAVPDDNTFPIEYYYKNKARLPEEGVRFN
ncbi:MAG TPA: translocation/assembly module TamB domain-containing protein [Flavobacteriaceae bacterium]|nr:translocation/assembly module TamB domain-containing protein [Flavobacteriaceae bacterium]